MARVDLLVVDDPQDVVGLLTEVFEATETFKKIEGSCTTDFKRLAKAFVEAYPVYDDAPRSFIEGCFERGRPVTRGTSSFKIEGDTLRVWGLGRIEFSGDPSRASKILRFGLEEDRIVIHTPGLKRKNGSFKSYDDRKDTRLTALRKVDPIVDYLQTNGVPPGKDFWRKHALLKHIMENPDVTRRELEEAGLRTSLDSGGYLTLMAQKNWDLATDFLPGMQQLLRAVSKPKGDDPKINILSERWNGQGQLAERKKREWSLPDVLDSDGSDSGRLKNQSYDAQITRAINRKSNGLL